MVPAGKVDRVLLRYSFMTLGMEEVIERLSIFDNKTEVKYDELNKFLTEVF